jgi:hypothetical protein
MKRKLSALASTLFMWIVMPFLCVLSFSVSPLLAFSLFVASVLTIAFKGGWTFMFMVNRGNSAYYFESGNGKEKLFFVDGVNTFFPIRLGVGCFSIAIYHVDAEMLVSYLNASNMQLEAFKKQHLAASTPKRGSIAVCSSGFVGLIIHDDKREITYDDGNKGFAYVGVQLFKDKGFIKYTDKRGKRRDKAVRTQVGGKWSARNPRVIGEIDLANFPYVDGLGVDGWNKVYCDRE